MRALFLGGDLDGQLREVRPVPQDQLWEYADYHIANGIARHESVSEEEVAVRLKAMHDAATLWSGDVPVQSDELQRYMRPQLLGE